MIGRVFRKVKYGLWGETDNKSKNKAKVAFDKMN